MSGSSVSFWMNPRTKDLIIQVIVINMQETCLWRTGIDSLISWSGTSSQDIIPGLHPTPPASSQSINQYPSPKATEVLKPEALREQIRAEAETLLSKYGRNSERQEMIGS